MTSTHHFHPSFDSLSFKKTKRNRSQSLNKRNFIDNHNAADSKTNDNKCSLPSIVELKPFNHNKIRHRTDRSQSFQITGYHNKNRMKSRKKHAPGPIASIPNTNINHILIDGADVDTKRRKHKLFGSNSKRRKSRKSLQIHNRVSPLSMTQQLSNLELSDHGHSHNLSDNLSMNVQGNRYEQKQQSSPSSTSKDNMEYPLDIRTIVGQSTEAKFTLAFLVKNFPRETALKVIRHPKTRSNPGWFSSQFLNSQDSEGNTALHILCKIGDYQFCEMLIHHSALINVLNFKRQTALDLAIIQASEGQDDHSDCRIVELLLKNRAIPGHKYYDNPEQYQSDLSIKLKSLIGIYLHPMVHPALSVMAQSDPTYQTNTFIPPIHLYEKPMKFRNQQFRTADETMNDIVSELSSPPPSSRYSRRAHINRSVAHDDFFNSGVNFMM